MTQYIENTSGTQSQAQVTSQNETPGATRQNTTTSTNSTNLSELNHLSFFNSNELNVCSVPGFQIIQVFFEKHVEIVELYSLLLALLFDAQRIREIPDKMDLDLNSICKYVFDKPFDSEQTLFCQINTEVGLDITIILLSMVRTLMNDTSRNGDANNYAIILLQSNDLFYKFTILIY